MARLFTLDEATALLPTLRPILQRIMDVRIRLERAQRDIVSQHWKARTNGHAGHADSLAKGEAGERLGGEGRAGEGEAGAGAGEAGAGHAALRDELNAELVRLHDLGVELKDPSLGLIDFRSLRDGRVVYLCWRVGEPTIAYWHALDAGFASREPL